MSKDNKKAIGYYIAGPITDGQANRFGTIGYRGVTGGLGGATALHLALTDIGTVINEEDGANDCYVVQAALFRNMRKQKDVLHADIDCLRDAFQQICDNRHLPAPQLADLAVRLADEHSSDEWDI